MARLIVKSEVVAGGYWGPGTQGSKAPKEQPYIYMLVSVCQENGQPRGEVNFDVHVMIPPHVEIPPNTLIENVKPDRTETYKPGLYLLSLIPPPLTPSGKYIFSVTVTSKKILGDNRPPFRGESLTTFVF